jgi:hypothetical protein
VWDACLDTITGHLTEEVKGEIKKVNTNLVTPGGMTSQLHVFDLFIKKPFKDHLWQLYNDWFLKRNRALTPGGKLKKPSVTVLGEWILTA